MFVFPSSPLFAPFTSAEFHTSTRRAFARGDTSGAPPPFPLLGVFASLLTMRQFSSFFLVFYSFLLSPFRFQARSRRAFPDPLLKLTLPPKRAGVDRAASWRVPEMGVLSSGVLRFPSILPDIPLPVFFFLPPLLRRDNFLPFFVPLNFPPP